MKQTFLNNFIDLGENKYTKAMFKKIIQNFDSKKPK